MEDRDTKCLKLIRGANARAHQNAGGLQASSTYDDFDARTRIHNRPIASPVSDSSGSPAFEKYLLDQRVVCQREVLSLECWLNRPMCNRLSAALSDIHLIEPATLRLASIEVFYLRQAG